MRFDKTFKILDINHRMLIKYWFFHIIKIILILFYLYLIQKQI